MPAAEMGKYRPVSTLTTCHVLYMGLHAPALHAAALRRCPAKVEVTFQPWLHPAAQRPHEFGLGVGELQGAPCVRRGGVRQERMKTTTGLLNVLHRRGRYRRQQ